MNKFTLLILLLLLSCHRNESSGNEKVFDVNGKYWKSFSISHYVNGINYTSTLVPIDYYLLKNSEPETLDSLHSIYKNERIIEFRFESNQKKDLFDSSFTRRNYNKSVSYMAFDIKNDFLLITDKNDTINCSGVILERNFQLAPYKSLLLFFGNVPPESGVSLLYEDNLFGNGIFKYNFTTRPIKL